MPALIFVGFGLLLIAGIIGSWYLKKKRREELTLIAQKLGFQFNEVDPFSLDESLPHHLLSLGDGRDCENSMWGMYKDLPVCEFDYWYYTESTDSDGSHSRTYHRFSCVAVHVPLQCQSLIVTGENLFTRLADGLGFRDIEFETEEFNKAWQVKCPDRKFANDFIDQRMMAWLMHAGTTWSFELAGPIALIYTHKLRPSEIPLLLQCAKQFVDHIPRVVSDLYPALGGSGAVIGAPWA